MTIETETTTAAAARQISEKATAELSVLRARIPVLEQTMNTLTTEQAELEQARTNDAHTLAHARNQAAVAEQAHKDALEYANYSIGLLAEHDATRKALETETHAKEARQQYETTAATMEEREATRAARIEALRMEYDQARDELTQCHAKVASVQRIEQQGLAQLGQSTYERLQATHESTHLAKKAALREQTARAKIEETRFFDAALAELEPWPALRAKLQPSAQLHKDTVTEALETGIAYFDALIAASQQLGNGVGRLACIRDLFYQWRDLFSVNGNDLAGIGTIRDDYSSLQRRRRYFVAALTEYRDKQQKR